MKKVWKESVYLINEIVAFFSMSLERKDERRMKKGQEKPLVATLTCTCDLSDEDRMIVMMGRLI